jgi:nucleotide-binding universal stress UspA family protein
MDVYKHLLIATDGSGLAQKAVDQGFDLAKALKARATVINVTPCWTSTFSGEAALSFPSEISNKNENYNKIIPEEASKIFSAVDDAAKKADITCDTMHVIDRFPADGIIETATTRGCDLIVMASHGRRGVRRLILGSQANEVVTQSTIPVLIYR